MLGYTEQLISEYVDGDLSSPLTRDLEHHRWVCQTCRATFLDFHALVAALTWLPMDCAKELGVTCPCCAFGSVNDGPDRLSRETA